MLVVVANGAPVDHKFIIGHLNSRQPLGKCLEGTSSELDNRKGPTQRSGKGHFPVIVSESGIPDLEVSEIGKIGDERNECGPWDADGLDR